MRTVELIKGIPSSVLGFGCAPILGAVNAKTARKALSFALDNGITHFDLARSYGYGCAEKFVGKIVKEKRDQIVLASKFGIKPNWNAKILRNAKPLIRRLQQLQKNNNELKKSTVEKCSKGLADYLLDHIIPLRAKDMRNSLEKSLKELSTDYLDYFFVHEPGHELKYFEELFQMAETLKTEGKIRAWGITYTETQKHLHQSYINAFDLLQFNSPKRLTDYQELVSEKGKNSNIIFSPIRGGNINLKPKEKIKQLFNDFPNSIILCSMFNLEHLKQNIILAG
jgi:aryl-alcohol dehydrogenase-like predicted oxidoreductase